MRGIMAGYRYGVNTVFYGAASRHHVRPLWYNTWAFCTLVEADEGTLDLINCVLHPQSE